MSKGEPLDVRFWTKVDASGGDTACWPWTAARDTKGYGWFQIEGKMRRAHTIAYRLTFGDYGDLIIRHKCDNPPCCNPNHLEPGTRQQNAQDVCDRQGWPDRRGENNARATFTEEQVLIVRARFKRYSREHGAAAIARDLNVPVSRIEDIVRGRCWSHI